MARKTQITKIYKRVVTATMALVFVAAGVATATFSFSWFTNRNNVTNSSFEGKTAGAYFARGDGTADAPYVINKPIHLYNLAWLQYIGYFKDKEPYFITESDLNMDGWVLPPIGTTENPFLGHLDGYDTFNSQTGQTQPAKIKNLTISNSLDDMSTRHPGSVTESTFTQPEITGLFGVVGDTSSSIVPTIQNLYLDKIQVKSKTDNALTGIVAGYVNGQLSEIYLSDSSLDLKDGTNKLTGYDQISKYTSVGYCESKYQTKVAKYKTTLYEPEYIGDASFNPSGGGSGDDNDWGGSISFLDINRRLNYMAAVSEVTEPSNYSRYYYSNDNYHLYFTVSNKNYEFNYKKSEINKIFGYLCEGTFLPLKVETDEVFNGGEIEGTNTYGSGSKMHTTEYYKNNSSEFSAISTNNTGYLVGEGGDSTKGYTGNVRTYIGKTSLLAGNGRSLPQGTTSYDGSKATIYTINSAKGTSTETITESNYTSFGYTKYSEVIQKFNDNMSGSSTIHGFHMMQIDENNSSNYLTLKNQNIKINNINYQNYQFLKCALNFTVTKKGYITTLISGTYGVSNTNFDLFKVTRDADKNIKSITRIKKIFKNNGTGDPYLYDAEDGDSSRGDLLFNFENTIGDSKLNSNCIYYFEIPVNPGDYIIGKSKNTDQYMGYLMYLDIGANAGGGETGTAVQRTKIYEVLEQINEAFTYPTGISIVSFDNAVLDTKTLCVTLGSTYSGSASIKRTSKTAADIVITASSSTGLAYYDPTITVTNDSKTYDSDIISESVNTTQTRRLTYLDYYKEDKIINMFAFEQTAEITTSSTANWGDISMKQYTTEKESTEFTSTQNLTIHNDDGESVELSSITIEDQDSYGYSIVFSLNLNELKPTDFSIDYVPTGSIDTDSNNFKVSGYKVTMSDVAYTLTSKNENYSLIINDVTK